MEDDLILVLFDAGENEDRLKIESQELTRCMKKRQQQYEKIISIINKKVHPKLRKTLIDNIEKYNSNFIDETHCENTLYYKNGFSDGMKILIQGLNY